MRLGFHTACLVALVALVALALCAGGAADTTRSASRVGAPNNSSAAGERIIAPRPETLKQGASFFFVSFRCRCT
jgi:hypothetical protein